MIVPAAAPRLARPVVDHSRVASASAASSACITGALRPRCRGGSGRECRARHQCWLTACETPVCLASDRDHHLVEVPFITRRVLRPADLRGVRTAELQSPPADLPVDRPEAAFGEHVLDHPQAEWDAEVEPDGMRNDRGWIVAAGMKSSTIGRHLQRPSSNRELSQSAKLTVPWVFLGRIQRLDFRRPRNRSAQPGFSVTDNLALGAKHSFPLPCKNGRRADGAGVRRASNRCPSRMTSGTACQRRPFSAPARNRRRRTAPAFRCVSRQSRCGQSLALACYKPFLPSLPRPTQLRVKRLSSKRSILVMIAF